MSEEQEEQSEGFFQSGNVWVLIPLAGVSIPIFAIVGENPLLVGLVGLVGAVLLVAAITVAARDLLALRHRHRMEELAAQERLSVAERDRFTAIDRLVEPESTTASRTEDRSPGR